MANLWVSYSSALSLRSDEFTKHVERIQEYLVHLEKERQKRALGKKVKCTCSTLH